MNRDSWNWGIFAQGEFALLPDLLLNAGLRYDIYESFGGSLNPHVDPTDGLLINLNADDVNARGLE